MAPTERASVQKMGRQKFVVQAVARRQWPKWGLAHRVILCPTCWPIAIQSKKKNGKNNEKNELKNYTHRLMLKDIKIS